MGCVDDSQEMMTLVVIVHAFCKKNNVISYEITTMGVFFKVCNSTPVNKVQIAYYESYVIKHIISCVRNVS